MWVYTVVSSYDVCINVSFNIGCECFIIGDSGGNAIGVCGVVSLILWCPNMGLVGEWYMLLCVLLCLSPGVVAGGDGVGNIAGAAHCEC